MAGNTDSVEMYLALTGPNGSISGDVVAKGIEGQIDIDSWSWGASLTEAAANSSAQVGGRTATNRTELGDLALSKKLDRSSTALMSASAGLTKLPKAVITLLHRVHQSLKLTVTLEGVRIKTYKLDVSEGERSVELTENLVLSADVVRIDYKPRTEAGGNRGTATGAVRSVEMRKPS